MTTRKKLLLLAGATLLCGVMGWRGAEKTARLHARAIAPIGSGLDPHRAPQLPRRAALVADAMADRGSTLTRREATTFVRALYRKEQLTRELDLEQLRYGSDYWQPECTGRELAKLQSAREAMLNQLSVEANQVLNDLFPDESGEPLALVAFFGADHAGPNLALLSPSLRERFEAEILAGKGERGLDREHLLEIAVRALPAADVDFYRRWNDRAAAAVRRQLIGFNPSEAEFVAILTETRLAEEDGEDPTRGAGLEAQLGAARYADFLKLKDPALHTALHDLQRLGLPLADAEWLAATRTRAIADLGEIWQSATLTDAVKRERVAQIEHDYGQAIAVKLALSAASLDGLEPGS